jgi:hypothetical protein
MTPMAAGLSPDTLVDDGIDSSCKAALDVAIRLASWNDIRL